MLSLRLIYRGSFIKAHCYIQCQSNTSKKKVKGHSSKNYRSFKRKLFVKVLRTADEDLQEETCTFGVVFYYDLCSITVVCSHKEDVH